MGYDAPVFKKELERMYGKSAFRSLVDSINIVAVSDIPRSSAMLVSGDHCVVMKNIGPLSPFEQALKDRKDKAYWK
jgi:hypothetical protein